MRISSKGLAIIMQYEGLSLKPYLCPAGVWTIGYGHTGDGKVSGKTPTITEPQAEQLLRLDVEDAERAVTRLVTVHLSQSQFDALVSFVFNLGTNNFRASSLLAYVNVQDTYNVYREFGKWNKARVRGKLVELAGLTSRRAAEANLYLSGVVYDFGEAGVIPEPAVSASLTGGK